MKVLKQCPILVGVVTIALFLSVVSFVFRDTAYVRFVDEDKSGKIPILALALKGAREGVFPWSEVEVIPGNDVVLNEESALGEEIVVEETDDGIEDVGESADSDDGEDIISEEAAQAPEEAEEEKVYEFTEVGDDYFCDALFIGDSRTVGLSEYCEPLDERATFYAKISLTIFDVMKKEFIKNDEGKKITLEEALKDKKFSKIYIMLGLNEIGTGNAEYFKNAYAEVVNRLAELQPDAIIYIQGIMHVTEKKSSQDEYFNNDNINLRNAAISELADQKRIFYIDMNEALDDENGNLDESLSFDDIHLKAASYQKWYEFLLHNAIVR